MRRIRYSLPCVYELIPDAGQGQILEYCNTCNGEMRHVRYCDLYEKCTRIFVSSNVRACITCENYTPQEADKRPERIPPEPISPTREHTTKHAIGSAHPEEKKGKRTVGSIKEERINRRKEVLEKLQETRRQQREERRKKQEGESMGKKYVLVDTSESKKLVWQYGITTVESRRNTLLPNTIRSLKNAGFDSPTLFVDGTYALTSYREEFGLDVTVRTTNIKTFGNWFLALMEMYIRNPLADRYALFQDDIIACKNLRAYLDRVKYPDKGYLNLITYPQNENVKKAYFPGMELSAIRGWYPSGQSGKGAQGLVFNHEAVILLLSHTYLINRPQDKEGWKNIDGGISVAMRRAGYKEYVHTPSLIRHTGKETTMMNPPQEQDLSFRGENWDALEMLS